MESTRELRVGLMIAAIASLMMFSRIGTGTLLGMIVAAALIFLGIVSYSRPASVIGLLIVCGSAAASLNQQSLTVVGNILNTVIGLLVPIYVLAWIALTSEGEPGPIGIMRKPAVLTAIYAVACLLSVGLVAVVLGVLTPAVSIGMPALMEIAIVLLAATLGIILLTSRNTTPRISSEEEPVEAGP